MSRGGLGWLGITVLICAVVACENTTTSTPSTSGTAGSGGGTSTGTGGTGGGTSSGTGGTTTSSSTSSTSSTGTGGTVIPCNSPYTDLSGECDLLQQSCPSGQTCQPVAQGNAWVTACTNIPGGMGEQGSECSLDSDCQAGLVCLLDRCAAFCCPDNSEPCVPNGYCDMEVSYGTSGFAMACSYDDLCELLNPDSCGPGMDCHIVDPDLGLAACHPPSGQQVGEGAPCTYLNDCGDSQTCNVTPPDNGVCRYLCSLSTWNVDPKPAPGVGGCPPAQLCVDLAMMNLPDIGRCTPS